MTEVQNAANVGLVCIICAQRKDPNTPGHICAVVPETVTHQATR
ncbi:hypothetical protein [Hymenobacter aranciens]|nr:hypothetical protein [Hymenobacter sp. ASUV-10]